MKQEDALETDDFVSAKMILKNRFGLDEPMVELVTTWLRDVIPPYERKKAASDLAFMASEKDSPTGWLRTVLERGTALNALRAGRAAVSRSESGSTWGHYEPAGTRTSVRAALRQLYEKLTGETPSHRLLDDDDGLPWKTFRHKCPDTARMISTRLNRLLMEDTGQVERDGITYSVVRGADYRDWLRVLGEFLDAPSASQ